MTSPSDFSILLNNFGRLYRIVVECLRFYANPKKFLLGISKQKTDVFVKKLAISFVLIESLLLLNGAVLISKFDIGLGKVPGLVIIDSLYSVPLIIIIWISLRIAKVASPLKKSFASVLFSKIFIGIPIQLLYFFFISSENYIFYIAFWIAVQLFMIYLMIITPFVFCDGLRQAAIVLSTTIIFSLLYVFIISVFSSFGPFNKDDEAFAGRLDPIFAEYRELKVRARVVDVKDLDSIQIRVDHFLEDRIQGDPAKNLEEFKEDAKFYIGTFKDKINTELNFFSDKNNYRFRTNLKNYLIYIAFLEECLKYLDSYYAAADYYKIRIENIALDKELNRSKSKLLEYSDLGDHENEKKLIREEIEKKGIGVKLSVLERVNERLELQISIQNKQIQLLKNENKIMEFLSNFAASTTKMQELRYRFGHDELTYLRFYLKWSPIII